MSASNPVSGVASPASGRRRLRVCIVGCGVSGITATVRLNEQFGEDVSIVILEKNADIGGTWHENRYPGAGCDVPSHFYCFSFAPNPNWSQFYSGAAEIQEYLRGVARKYGVYDRTRFQTEFVGATWREASSTWVVESRAAAPWAAASPGGVSPAAPALAAAAAAARPSAPAVEEYDVLILSSAALNRPAVPSFPGLASFSGSVFHTARWDASFAPEGRRIAVIGTGASAVQLIPRIAPPAAAVKVFQRTPGWVLPRGNYTYSSCCKGVFAALPLLLWLYRMWLWLLRDIVYFNSFKRDSCFERLVRWMSERHIRKGGAAKPEMLNKLVPNYPPGCKRLLISDEYVPTLALPHVDLVTDRIVRVTPRGVVTAAAPAGGAAGGGAEVEHEVDTIVLATGFQVTSFFSHLQLVGRNGMNLNERWSNPDNVEAYKGTMISGVPNAFVLLGPNTALGHSSIIFIIETQVNFLVAVLAEKQRRAAAAVDVSREVQAAYNAPLQRDLAGSVWAGSCDSWYKTATGKIVTLWPHNLIRFALELRNPPFEKLTWT